MRFDIEALRQHIAAKAALSVPALVAAGGVALAMLAVLYGVMRGADDVPADAVVVNGPVFTPVALTPPAPEPAVRPSSPGSVPAMRFDDAVSVTRAVQSELKRAGCYQGPVNGVWSVPTRKAMAEFTSLVNARLPVDRPDSVLLVLLETHNTTSCSDAPSAGADERRGRERRTETASIEQRRTDEKREVTRVSVETEAAVPKARSEDLGYAAEEKQAPVAASSVETASVEPEPGSDALGTGEAAALAAAGTAAATTHYKASPPERRRTSRRYKKQPSLARSVSKGFRQIQRSLNKLF